MPRQTIRFGRPTLVCDTPTGRATCDSQAFRLNVTSDGRTWLECDRCGAEHALTLAMSCLSSEAPAGPRPGPLPKRTR